MSENTKQFFINLDVESEERYDMSKFMEWDTDNFDVLPSTFMNEIRSINKQADYIVQSEEGRPDLVSYNNYGTTQYWWIILAYNALDDVDSIRIGMRLGIPSVDAIEDLFFSLKSRESAAQRES